MNPIDLNIEEPTLAEPFRCEIEPTLGGLACIGSGTVKCKIELDRGGEKISHLNEHKIEHQNLFTYRLRVGRDNSYQRLR